MNHEAFSQNNSAGREDGIPWIWVCGGALITLLLMILMLFGVILSEGLSALWPSKVMSLSRAASSQAIGIPMRTEDTTNTSDGQFKVTQKTLIYSGNRDFNSSEFFYIEKSELQHATYSNDLWFIERAEWGPFIGTLEKISITNPSATSLFVSIPSNQIFQSEIGKARLRVQQMDKFESENITPLNQQIEEQRLKKRRFTRESQSSETPLTKETLLNFNFSIEKLSKKTDLAVEKLTEFREMDARSTVFLKSPSGKVKEIRMSQIIRAFQPNKLGIFQRIEIYLSRMWEFVSREPREANSAGGVFPALFGTVVMTLLMTIFVLPVGILTAVYMREIAKQGFLVSLVRIAVGNLAGVPSIVYGVFGLGFFCYSVGSSIDRLFFSDKLPNPTFGTGGILWASLTLAFLTVPVVIVSTEEALSTVPRTLREASYGCGATRLQTLIHIVLPKAMPGIMTGLILAMARGIGEVAPLLLTGVVKLAPALPIDGQFPFIHLERSFMHLGFHIYDLGFQSRSTEITRPMVFATTTLLVGIVLALNFIAIKIRSKLRMRFEGRGAF